MQYIHNLEYGDNESITLSRAIEHYKKFLEEELKDGAKCPFWADLQSIKVLERKLSGIEFLEQCITRDMNFSLDDLSKMVDEDYLFDKYIDYKESLDGNNMGFKEWYLEVYLIKN